MPTLEDLREAFAELERRAPVALSDPIRPTHRRRWTAVGLAAACTAALAVAIAVPVSLSGGGNAGQRTSERRHTSIPPIPPVPAGFTSALPAPADGQSPELTYGFAIPGTVAGYTVIPDRITRTYQHATIYGPTDPPGQVFVYYRGSFDVGMIAGNTVDEESGSRGYYANLRLPGFDHPVRALVWNYATDGEAVVLLRTKPITPVPKGGNRRARERAAQAHAEQAARLARTAQSELLLADALAPAHDRLRSPVRVGNGSGTSVDSMYTGADPVGGVDLAASDRTWSLEWSADELRPDGKPTVRIAGHDWIVYGPQGEPTGLGLDAGGWGMTVTPDRSTSLAAMKQFVAGLQLAPDPIDENTWFDAESALP